MSSTWLETATRSNRRVRPIRELTDADLELFLFLEQAREREAKRLDVHQSASGIVLITILLASLLAFLMGAAMQWIIGRVFAK
jgi:hypothetical protein